VKKEKTGKTVMGQITLSRKKPIKTRNVIARVNDHLKQEE
jgi:hypothetical protein